MLGRCGVTTTLICIGHDTVAPSGREIAAEDSESVCRFVASSSMSFFSRRSA
jgi:hypothetical protein